MSNNRPLGLPPWQVGPVSHQHAHSRHVSKYRKRLKGVAPWVFFFLIVLFIDLFLAVQSLCCCTGFCLVVVLVAVLSLQCAGFSLRRLLLFWSMGSRPAGFSSCSCQALEHKLSSCGERAWLLRGMWDLHGPEIKPVSLTLAGRFVIQW